MHSAEYPDQDDEVQGYKLGDIKGESTEDAHKDWLVLTPAASLAGLPAAIVLNGLR